MLVDADAAADEVVLDGVETRNLRARVGGELLGAQHRGARVDGGEPLGQGGLDGVEVDDREDAGGLVEPELHLGVLQHVGQDHRAGAVLGVGGHADEADVGDVADREHRLAGALGEDAVLDEAADRAGAVGQERADLAVGVELLDLLLAHRVGLAAAPEAGGGVEQPVEGLVAGLLVDVVVEAAVLGRGGDGLGAEGVVEEGAHRHRAGEVGRGGVGEAPRLTCGPRQQRLDRLHVGLVQHRAVVDQRRAGLLPGGLAALDRDPEVGGHGRVVEVDVLGVGQVGGPAAGPQVGLHTGGEVLAVDPDRVDRAAGGASGLLLAEHLVDRLGGVGDLDLVEGDPEVGEPVGHLAVDERVEPLVAAVHVPVDALALRLGEHGVPVGGVDRGGLVLGAAARGGQQRGGGEGGRQQGGAGGSAGGAGHVISSGSGPGVVRSGRRARMPRTTRCSAVRATIAAKTHSTVSAWPGSRQSTA